MFIYTFSPRVTLSRACRSRAVRSLPAGFGRGAGGKIFIPGGIRVADKIPHFQKHYGMASYGVAFQADSGVLPVSVGMGDVKIFIGQVKASGIADPVVDYRNLPVVPVVHENIEEGHQRVENTALDSLPVQAAHEFRLDVANASEIVIDKAYFNAFRNLPKEYFFNAVKGLGILTAKYSIKINSRAFPKSSRRASRAASA